MKFSIEEFRAWENKKVTLLGMSGVGKTHLSMLLRSHFWFHYSGDYRIGTRYLDEPIMDLIKQQAMQVPFLRDLLRRDWIYIRNNIKVDNLGPVLANWRTRPLRSRDELAPALAAGNTVILKPAEQTSLSALRLAELATAAGIPDGVFNVVPGFGETAGQALGLHDGVDMVAFTGSTEVGRAIQRSLAGTGKSRLAVQLVELIADRYDSRLTQDKVISLNAKDSA